MRRQDSEGASPLLTTARHLRIRRKFKVAEVRAEAGFVVPAVLWNVVVVDGWRHLLR